MFTKLYITKCISIQVVHQLLLKLLSLHPKTACFDIGSVSHPLHVLFVFSKIKNMTLLPCMTMTFIKADGYTHVLPSNWMCYSMIHSDAPHCSMVYYETNETSSRSLHCIVCLCKKGIERKFKNGERMKRIIFIWTLAKIFCALFFLFLVFSPFFIYEIMCPIQFWGT